MIKFLSVKTILSMTLLIIPGRVTILPTYKTTVNSLHRHVYSINEIPYKPIKNMNNFSLIDFLFGIQLLDFFGEQNLR